MVNLKATVNKKDIDNICNKIDSRRNRLKSNIPSTLNQIAVDVRNQAIDNLKASIRPNETLSEDRPLDSIFNNWDVTTPVNFDGKTYTKHLYNNSNHAMAVEEGTMSATWIRPKNAKFLEYQLADGTIMIRDCVKGQIGYHYTKNALKSLEKDIKNIYVNVARESWMAL